LTLPESIHDLLASRIDSFEKLELVCTLAEAPRTTQSMEQLSKALKMPRDEVRQVAMELRAESLVHVTTGGEVQLLPPTEKDRAAVAELVNLYREDRFAVVKAMGEISLARIRNLASRAFADAFIIGRKPRKGGGDG
jgi:hypothetical protein